MGCSDLDGRGDEYSSIVYWGDPNDGAGVWFTVSRRPKQKHSFKIKPKFSRMRESPEKIAEARKAFDDAVKEIKLALSGK